uniref:Protein kinase domain-containing protein n=1 Tax=Ciona savignyi TaxID=51511 RepID=H2ZBN8_CIOSA
VMGSKEKYNFKYEVDAAQNHSGGFTLYKILIKEFKTTGPLEHIREQVVWKRYNDFKYLHRDLFILHKELYLSGRFPGFVKPKIFGRFDEKVINERMKCAQCLLDFAIQHKPLYSSKAFKQFFINAKPVEKISEEMNKNNGERPTFVGSTNTPIDTTSLSLQEQVIPSDIPQPVQALEPDSTQKLNSEEMTNSQGFSSQAHMPQPASFSLGGDTIVAASSSNQIDEGFVLLPKITRTNSIEIAKEKHRKSSKARAYLNKVRESLPDIFDDKADSVKQDASQSNGFRKIVSAYELRPEHNPTHSASNSFMDLKRFFTDSEKTEKPPTYRHSSSDLLNYKVLGVTGRVMLVMDNSTNKTYALKIIQKSSHRNFRVRKAVIPTNVPYMVRLYRYYSLEGCICLLLEYAAGGRLWDQLSAYSVVCNEGMVPQEPEPVDVEIDREACKEENGDNKQTESSQDELNTSDDVPEVSNDEIRAKVPKDEEVPDTGNLSDEMMIPESIIKLWSAEIVVAVGTLHSVGILCRNLNPDNILLSHNGRIRLSYFGKWKNVEHCDRFLSKSGYTAPEITSVIYKKTEACDWWSVGAIIYELLVGKPLIESHPSRLGSHDNLSLPSFVSVEGKSLLRGLLRYYPTERLGYGVTGLDEIMAHPFYRGVDWNQLIEEYQESV